MADTGYKIRNKKEIHFVTFAVVEWVDVFFDGLSCKLKPAIRRCLIDKEDSEERAMYGKLYNWYAINDPRGLTPEGWHIPSDEEWKLMIDSLGGKASAGRKMKSTNGWNSISENGNGTNESGFDGLPNDIRQRNGRFKYVGYFGYWWGSNNYNRRGA